MKWERLRAILLDGQLTEELQWSKPGYSFQRGNIVIIPDLSYKLACNLGNFLCQTVLPKTMRHWRLTTLREKLIKAGAKVVCHSRKIVFQMAEVAVPRELFQIILESMKLDKNEQNYKKGLTLVVGRNSNGEILR